MAKKKSFEENLIRLEEIVNEMENPQVGLENAVKLYKEGVELSTNLYKRLEAITEEVSILQETADGLIKEKKFSQ